MTQPNDRPNARPSRWQLAVIIMLAILIVAAGAILAVMLYVTARPGVILPGCQ
jgi:hypothetical protein